MTTPSTATAQTLPPSELHPGEQRVVLHDVSWRQLEAIETTLEDVPGVHLTYLEGALEIMTVSFDHEVIKKCVARLLEAYAEETGVSLNGAGSMTLRKRQRRRRLEPDECYFIGPRRKRFPDLAIEVALSSGGIDKLEVYRGLGVGEVWIWKAGSLLGYALRREQYRPVPRSRLFPELDLDRLVSFIDLDHQTEAVRSWRAALRA
jgi:Uma2 family endonuclease